MAYNRKKISDFKDDKDLFRYEDGTLFGIKNIKKKESIEKKKKAAPKKKEKIKIIEQKEINYSEIINKTLTITIVVVCLIGLLSIIDIVRVTRNNKLPLFAINTKKYNDGGTKEYLGFGYKVIKYNNNKRKDMVIGGWNLEYNINPLKVDILKLEKVYLNDLNLFNDKYLNNYISINNINNKNNINVICDNKKIYKNVSGILYDYSYSDKLNLYMKNCYFE